MSAAKHDEKMPDFNLPANSPWANAWKISAAIGGIGVLGSVFGAINDPHRFAFSWLFAFVAFLAIALGALFFVIGQHISHAAWGVTLRRVAEFFMVGLPVFAVLWIPIFLSMNELYPWTQYAAEPADEAAGESHDQHSMLSLESVAHAQEHGGARGEEHGGSGHGADGHGGGHHTPQHAEHEEVIRAKLAYLNVPGFAIRALIYFLIWSALAYFYFKNSIDQDKSKDTRITLRLENWSPLCTIGFGLTLTFAAFDWMMSLEPTWFSTIFGVQYYSVAAVSSLATLIVTLHALRGHLHGAVNVEHYHDIGKLLFGFLVFWAYISFSQFMLIWYASIPEETSYYHIRWADGWKPFSTILLIVHFVVPFFLIISRSIKRRVPVLAFAAGWLLVTHVLECFWLVMPYVSPGELTFHWIDVTALFAVGGVYLSVVFFVMNRFPLIPVGDPRVAYSMHHEVT